MQGSGPSIQEALDLHFILSKSDTQLRQPVGLEEQLMSDTRLDSIVGMSMLQLLQVIPSSSCAAKSKGWCRNQFQQRRFAVAGSSLQWSCPLLVLQRAYVLHKHGRSRAYAEACCTRRYCYLSVSSLVRGNVTLHDICSPL